ncbi:MAG TPA: helix-turn-helix transcriptional regulator [Acidimicrobiales bacterium]|nr:helix-turn-helix transcriptional regulator [Acidimicrobiales bacterium]
MTINPYRRSGQPGPPESPTRAVYVISVAAELAGMHPQTLRVYERRGLVDPSRTGGGNRRYSQRDIEQLRRIQDLTAAGLNLEGVRRVLELEAELTRLQAEVDRVRAEAQAAVEKTHRHYRRDLVPVRQAIVARPKPATGRTNSSVTDRRSDRRR